MGIQLNDGWYFLPRHIRFRRNCCRRCSGYGQIVGNYCWIPASGFDDLYRVRPEYLIGGAPGAETIFIDELSPFSNRDGAATAGKPMYTLRNCDNDHLAEQLEVHLKAGQKPLVVTDGIFSIRGVAGRGFLNPY
jgi:hypothetical protein